MPHPPATIMRFFDAGPTTRMVFRLDLPDKQSSWLEKVAKFVRLLKEECQANENIGSGWVYAHDIIQTIMRKNAKVPVYRALSLQDVVEGFLFALKGRKLNMTDCLLLCEGQKGVEPQLQWKYVGGQTKRAKENHAAYIEGRGSWN